MTSQYKNSVEFSISRMLVLHLSLDFFWILSTNWSWLNLKNFFFSANRKQKKTSSVKNSKICQIPSKSEDSICLMDAINYNGLVFFLTSNLLTGAVNLVIKTLYVPPLQAFAILTLYMFISCLAMNLLRYCNIALRFW